MFDEADTIAELLDAVEMECLEDAVKDTLEIDFYDTSAYDKLFEYYMDSGLMPYGTAKARTGDPVEWILNRVEGLDLFGEKNKIHEMGVSLADAVYTDLYYKVKEAMGGDSFHKDFDAVYNVLVVELKKKLNRE